MDRLVVSFLNTSRQVPDALASPLGTARWWSSVQDRLPRALRGDGVKPRFDARLACELRMLRERITFALERGAGLEMTFTGSAGTDAVLFPVAFAAASLLASERAIRVRICAHAHCGLRFLDETKNGLRRWCSLRCMERARAPRRRTIRR
jgi:predicted RNA-binding Zn ribbon-like protein